MKITAVLWLLPVLLCCACQKYKDTPGDSNNPLLNRPYCNDPIAVNYNWDFPGKPDNSVCIYPSDVFKGEYTYTDSLYDARQVFLRRQEYDLSITAPSRTKLTLSGLCNAGSISLTAVRRLRADADTVVGFGQLLCRPQDTLTGNITRPDIKGNILFDFTVSSDTGIIFHRGSAVQK